jgi:hypothetical protein
VGYTILLWIFLRQKFVINGHSWLIKYDLVD